MFGEKAQRPEVDRGRGRLEFGPGGGVKTMLGVGGISSHPLFFIRFVMARRTRTTRTTARPKATISRGKKRRFTAKQKKAIAAAIGTLAVAGVGVAAAKRYFKAKAATYDELKEFPVNAAKQPQASSVQASGIRDETEVPLSSPSPTASTAKREAKREANRVASRAAMVANAAAGNAYSAYVQSEAAAERGVAKGKKIEKAVIMVQRRHRYNSTRKTTAARTIQKIHRGKSVRDEKRRKQGKQICEKIFSPKQKAFANRTCKNRTRKLRQKNIDGTCKPSDNNCEYEYVPSSDR